MFEVKQQVAAGQGWASSDAFAEGALLERALKEVAAEVKDAMRTLKRLPLPREVSGMAKTTASIFAAMAQVADEETKRRRPPSSAAIDRVDAVIECLLKVEPMDARNLLVVRGLGYKWEAVIKELSLDCSISTIKRRHNDALTKMLCVVMQRDAKKG